MIKRKASAVWQKGLKDGNGKVTTDSKALDASYNFSQRFEDSAGTNPEELIGAAHASCFSMALSADLEKAGFKPNKVSTKDTVCLEKDDNGFSITEIIIDTEADIPDIDEKKFREIAEGAKENCPVSRALKVKMTLNARLA